MLFKLAFGNVRRAGRDYLVYLLTLTLAVTVFYAFNTIAIQVDLAGVEEINSGMGETLGNIIFGLTVFLALVMGFLMVYANNFIMKRRKKEFGLYQVLGMSRGQVARVMALETLLVSLTALILGIVLGVLLSLLMVFFTASLFKTQISGFHFFFSPEAFLMTVACLAVIFLVTLVFNLRVVARARVIDLMSAGRKNETIKVRNPWISALIFLAGLAAVIVAYVRLLNDGLPISGVDEEMQAFCITTAIVVVGTLLLFFGLSGFLLRALQSVRGLYWRGLNMVTLRQLAAKVNTVSLSMAVISMILFLAITAVTTGMSLASVMNENVEHGTPVDYTSSFSYFSPQTVEEMNADESYTGGTTFYAVADAPIDLMERSKQQVVHLDDGTTTNFDLSSIAGRSIQVDTYDSTPRGAEMPVINMKQLCDMTGTSLPKGMDASDVTTLGLAVVSASQYNDYLKFRGMDTIDFGSDGYTILCDLGESVSSIYDAVLSEGHDLEVGGTTLHPVQDAVDSDASVFVNSMMGMNAGTIVMPDEVITSLDLPLYMSYLLLDYRSDIDEEEGDEYIETYREYGSVTNDAGLIIGGWGTEATRLETYEGLNSMNGLISYLAIYIGFVLVVSCAAILTIQQLSGVADAGGNYRILSELGTSLAQISHSVLIQQLIFFIFPLLVGMAHSIVALRVIIDLVTLFGGLAIGGTVGLTAVIFLVAYGGYFLLTYQMSRSIVRDAVRARHAV